jgi:hypothetical protein
MLTKTKFLSLFLLVGLSALLAPLCVVADDYKNEPSSKAQLDAGVPQGATGEISGEMSAEQRKWEDVLKNNLGSFYYPRYLEAKRAGKTTAWDYVKDVPGLPRVLLIGDSVSRGYTIAVRKALAGKANVHRAPANCGPTKTGIKKLTVWLGDGRWDVISFNFGIHDRRTSDQEYQKRLTQITKRLEGTGAKLLWVNTTSVPPGANEYVKGASEQKNRIAAKLMQARKIPIVNLYKAVLPVLDKYQHPKNCHFNDSGYTFLGGIVGKGILTRLESENPKKNAKKDVTQVFFAGGQSNAKREWAAMIERELKKAYGQSAVLVHSYHPGAWLNQWFKSGAIQKNYLVDFHDAKGTGALQKTTKSLEKQGKPWRLSGVFWLQGEGDSGSDAAIKQYSATFNGMVAQVNKDLGINYEYARVFAVIDGNHEKKYDDPKNLAGRSRAAVDKMRAVLIKLGSADGCGYVDTRGMPRRDAWHLESSALKKLGTAMGKKCVSLLKKSEK